MTSRTDAMRRVTQRTFGGPEVLEVVDDVKPAPGSGAVLVQVNAASVNFGEVNVRAGRVPQVGTPPFTLGSDLSGTVVEIGEGVSEFKAGDEVYGCIGMGAYAEYVSVPAANLALKPEEIDHRHAAALPLAGLTAYQALVESAQLQSADVVLIHAAAGGVGHLAVQIAKALGAYVIGTARAVNHPWLRELGADELVDYTAADFTDVVRDSDVVLDLVGGEYGPRSLACLKPNGLLIGAALNPGITAGEADARGKRYRWLLVRASREHLEAMSELVRRGSLRAAVQETFQLDELGRAHRLIEEGHVTGKVVVIVHPEHEAARA